jgi:tRNA nucleotidyltransferase (CCA-adding enzyme)
MQTYLVGGAVRDALLGRLVSDRDWVVVGASPQQMLDQGFVAVGRDFPVFLHPQTHEEYALARTERKSAPGYRGFVVHASPEVTLEDDLRRRDLTINAMAQDAQGVLIDPYGGRADLDHKLLRHVSAAFVEDPVRILRVARFAARFPDFDVAPETETLMREMAEQGELDALVAERVWQELARGLMEAKPSRMFEVLRSCGALKRLLPEVDRLWGVPQPVQHHPEVDTGEHLLLVLDISAKLDTALSVRYACLGHDLGKGTTPPDLWPRHIGHEARSVKLITALSERLRVPRDCAELAVVVAREHGHVHASMDLSAAALMRLLERCDALRQPGRFELVLQSCECDARGRAGMQERPYPQAERLRQALAAALSVATAPIAAAASAAGAAGPEIGATIAQARLLALKQAIGEA